MQNPNALLIFPPSMQTKLLILISACALLISALALHFTDSNSQVFLYINNQIGAILPKWLWANATLVADTVYAAALLCILAAFRPQALPAILFLLIAGGLFVHLGKQTLLIPRPPAVLDNSLFSIIGPRLTRHSFPSGHSFTALVCFGFIALFVKSLGLQLLLIAFGFFCAVSRITVGAHWPLDVTTGAGFGLLFAWLGYYLNQRFKWYEMIKLNHFTMAVLTLGSAYLAFHDSRYPDTYQLSIITAIITVAISIKLYWWPLFKKSQRPNQISKS